MRAKLGGCDPQHCDNPEHQISTSAPSELGPEDRIRWTVDHWPPLTEEQLARLAVLLRPGGEMT